MEIACTKLAELMKKELTKEVKKLKKKLKLATILIGQAKDQISFVKIKRRVAHQLGIEFEFIHLKIVPTFEKFMVKIKEQSLNPKTTGIIIQQPLPAQLSTTSIYNYIPLEKEIEGHRNKSCFYSPIGLSVLTILKYIYNKPRIRSDLFVNPEKDRSFFKRIFHNKKIVLIGRGITGGEPIGKILSDFKINYINLHSHTPQPESYCREADIIITAVGKKTIEPQNLKPGVILINVGLRKEGNQFKGDYEEREIKKIASFYTPTPGGIGPIDVLYLYKNLIDAAKLQNNSN